LQYYYTMKSKKGTQSDFEQQVEVHYHLMRENYDRLLVKALSKESMLRSFKNKFLEHNEMIPFNTVFFDELYTRYEDYFNLGEEDPIQQTLQFLPLILETSREAFEQLTIAMMNEKTDYLSSPKFPKRYKFLLSEGGCDLSELFRMEHLALKTDEQTAFQQLALYLALKRLISEVENDPSEKELPKPSEKHHMFTHAQQVLFAYYLFKMAGIEPRLTADISVCAKILHGITGIPYTSMNNSDLYKKFRNPFNHGTPKKVIQDLQLIRSYFEGLEDERILGLIDKDIKGLKQD